MKRDIRIYCDGASRKDGRGGWGFVVFEGVIELYSGKGGEYDVTNNQMELEAAIRALRAAPRGRVNITMFLDSAYVVNGITEHIDTWLRTNWRTSSNKPVKNVDRWVRLAELDLQLQPVWQHVKGHSGIYGNERADELATAGVPLEKKHEAPVLGRARHPRPRH